MFVKHSEYLFSNHVVRKQEAAHTGGSQYQNNRDVQKCSEEAKFS